ncbi:hypothetical protein LTR66_017700, partial [Elasticomyces elasticus]
NDVTQEDFNSMITAANTGLSALDFEIRSTLHQQTRERQYALVNTTSDILTQLATVHSNDEIAYIKRLLDEIFETNNTETREAMCIAAKDAINLARAGRRETQGGNDTQQKFNLTANEAELLLNNLVIEGWLEKSPQNFFSLSPRALMELKSWLVDTYNEPKEPGEGTRSEDKIKFCHACKEIVTMGQRCADQNCPARLHDICTQAFFRVQRSRSCPICKNEWDGKHFVGEKAVTTSESYLRGKRRSGARVVEAEASGEGEEDIGDND